MHALTIFLSAFLLFLVQPILAKLILPRFGGGAAIWATCLVFFQATMLLGYAYAHALAASRARWVRWLHIALLLGSLALLPIIPSAAWRATGDTHPVLPILGLLTATIGLPFALLSTTSPLLQAWIARTPGARNPYRLFALSNLASLLALVAYPWLIEPWLGTATQARLWSLAFGAYVALACVVAYRAPPLVAPRTSRPDARPTIGRQAAWLALAALASYELVAVTNHLTQNIASFPMMWVVPLTLYLLSFVLCFDADRWLRPRLFLAAAGLVLLAMGWALVDKRVAHNLPLQVGVFLPGLFVLCMFCHGELARDRPAASQLTRFYLCVASGGVGGGALVGLGAPLALPGYFEVEIGLVLTALAIAWRAWPAHWRWRALALLLPPLALGATLWRIQEVSANAIALKRSFYGVITIRERGNERTLMHGSIMHGRQALAADQQRTPTTYYTATSGVGRLLTSLADRPIVVGAVGLGAGTVAAYGKLGDAYRFFEIDPDIVDAARRHFTYLADSRASVSVVTGDGRLALEAEPPARFDAIVVDAFSGDSIPVHLLTREAVALYLSRLKPDGVVALHVSNRFLDLRPVVHRIALDLALHAAYIADADDKSRVGQASSDWILLARTAAPLSAIAAHASDLPPGASRAWSDNYSNIVQALRAPGVLVRQE